MSSLTSGISRPTAAVPYAAIALRATTLGVDVADVERGEGVLRVGSLSELGSGSEVRLKRPAVPIQMLTLV